MATDAALLALVVDDTLAIHVLAAWAALELPLSAIDDGNAIDPIRELVEVSGATVRSSLIKLRAARVLVDGGISDLADRMLQTHVQNRTIGRSKK